MTLWIIEPRDPLIVRDGRPFGPNPGARATTLPFPFPSTIVGALRHKAGLDTNNQFDRNQISTVLSKGMCGPLLVEIDDDDTITDWMLPAPADALLLDPEQSNPSDPQEEKIRTVLRFWLAPREQHASTNLPKDLLLVGPSEHRPEKVSTDAPRFWGRDIFYNWLVTPTNDKPLLSTLGIRRLETNTRMHVSLQPEQQTAREGALFQTSGLEFTWRDWQQAKEDKFVTRRLALAAWFDGETPQFTGGFAPLGGERRLMRWSKLIKDEQLFTDTQCDDIFARIEKDGRCRVVLLTPAYFADGYRPPINWTRGGVTATLKAAAVPRMQTISGWDMDADNGKDEHGRPRPRGKPKPTRRLAPAGSVYYVDFAGLSGVEIRKWFDDTWLKNVSDDIKDGVPDQHRLDGFGLAVLGVWPQ
jgi:CRISPR-associated protein Cmr3